METTWQELAKAFGKILDAYKICNKILEKHQDNMTVTDKLEYGKTVGLVNDALSLIKVTE